MLQLGYVVAVANAVVNEHDDFQVREFRRAAGVIDRADQRRVAAQVRLAGLLHLTDDIDAGRAPDDEFVAVPCGRRELGGAG